MMRGDECVGGETERQTIKTTSSSEREYLQLKMQIMTG